jgi:Zn-dependent M28 family amino/carboxypeptidase
MDTVTGSPGANDNASGVAVVLETARIVAGTPKAGFVRFVAFGSEEYGNNGLHHVGSQVFVNRLNEEGRRRLAGMISVDMVADGRPLIVATAGIGPPDIADRFASIVGARDIGVDRQTTCDCSDNGPFERAGITAAFLWSGSEPNYHDDSDKVRNMKPDDLVRTGRAVRYFVKQLDVKMLRRLRRS